MDRPHQMFSTSLANGLAVMLAFTDEAPVLSNADLARRTRLSRGTITRLTFSLCELGLLEYDAVSRRYRVGAGAVSLAYPFLAHMGIQRLALPLMQTFADRNRVSVSLGMRSGLQMVYVESCRAFDGMLFKPDVGACLPLMRTAMGRAWLAGRPLPERIRALHELRSSAPSEWRRYAREIRNGITSCEEHGFCVNTGDAHSDMQGIAVPLGTAFDAGPVVLNCGIPVELVRPGVADRLGGRLVVLARRIEGAWNAQA